MSEERYEFGGNEDGAQWRKTRLYVELTFMERQTSEEEVLKEFQRWVQFGSMKSTIRDAIGSPKVRRLRRVKSMTTDNFVIEGELPDDQK